LTPTVQHQKRKKATHQESRWIWAKRSSRQREAQVRSWTSIRR